MRNSFNRLVVIRERLEVFEVHASVHHASSYGGLGDGLREDASRNVRLRVDLFQSRRLRNRRVLARVHQSSSAVNHAGHLVQRVRAAQQRRELLELLHVKRPAGVLVEAPEDFARARLRQVLQPGHGYARGVRLAEIERARAVRVRVLERRLRALGELGVRVFQAHRGGDRVAEVVPERAGQERGHRLGSRAPRISISTTSIATLGERVSNARLAERSNEDRGGRVRRGARPAHHETRRRARANAM
mmetsp:Transcript_14332/g.61452  ORF Transcript_14332/g.61452 Transcript_14332/m.61452 type:complete len:246 (+) Transcript_14332:2580-3317(+)